MILQPVSSYNQVKTCAFIIVALYGMFLLSMPLFPFIDLPNHLSEATIYKYYGHEGNILSKFYAPTPWYYPNTFHTVFCSLFPSVEFGNKVFHWLCIVLTQAALFLVIRQLGGNPWYGLLGTLFTFNYNMTFGFVGFAISIPTLIFLFYLILRDIQYDRLILKAGISFMLILLFLMHAQNALFGLVLYGMMMIYAYRHSIAKMFIRCILVPLPLLMLIFTWWFSREAATKEESTLSYLIQYYLHDYFSKIYIRFRVVVFDNFQLREGTMGILIATLIFSLIVLPIIWLKPWKKTPFKNLISGNAVYAVILVVASLGCYLFLPDQLPGQTPLFQRFCTILILSLIILGSLWLSNITSMKLKYFVLASIFLYTGLWFEYIYTFNKINRTFNKDFFAKVDRPSTIAGLIYQNKYRGRRVYIHYPNYFLVWNKGAAASKIIDYRFGVVKRIAPETVIPFYNEYVGEGYKVHREYQHLDYLLVHGKAPVYTDLNVDNFSLVNEVGDWKLFKRNLPDTKVSEKR